MYGVCCGRKTEPQPLRPNRRPGQRLTSLESIKFGFSTAIAKAALPIAANVVSSSMAKSSMPCRRAESPGLVLSEIVMLWGIENWHSSYNTELFSLIVIIYNYSIWLSAWRCSRQYRPSGIDLHSSPVMEGGQL